MEPRLAARAPAGKWCPASASSRATLFSLHCDSAANASIPFSLPSPRLICWRHVCHKLRCHCTAGCLQVQRLVLESFLGWRWHVEGQGAEAAAGQPSLLADVPTPFVLEVLLPAAGQAHMWRGEGAAALQQQVSAWVGRYSAAALGQEQQRQLLIALLDQLGGAAGGSQQKQQQVLRPLAQTVAAALVASSQAVAAATAAARPTDGSSSEERQAHEWRLLFLQRLQRATASLSSSWGSEGASSAYAADMCSSLVQAAAAAVPLSDIRGDDDSSGSGSRTLLLAIGTWLSQLPLPLLLPGGALHLPAAHWLQAGGQQQRLATLASCVRDYLAAAAAPDAAPRDGWEVQAGGLAQLALLLASPGSSAGSDATPPDHLAPALSSWANTLGMIHRR